MDDLRRLAGAVTGELITPDQPGYDAVRRSPIPAPSRGRPQAVLRCRSLPDVVAGVDFARTHDIGIAARGGGHCFAGRSSTDGLLLDLSGLHRITVADDGVATIGAGARLAEVYRDLHAHGLTLPAGCGPTVGIAGLALGGGIGLLGRQHGLTCDRLIGAEVVLADGRVVDCDQRDHPDLFWALRGAGGGQFGIVTTLRFAAVVEPSAVRVVLSCPAADPVELVAAWQQWAPDTHDEISVACTLLARPGGAAQLLLSGLATLTSDETTDVLRGFCDRLGIRSAFTVSAAANFQQVKASFDDERESSAPQRLRSEFFDRTMSEATIRSLLDLLDRGCGRTSSRRLTFTPMGGAYNRVGEDATAFAHRGERFLLEHVGAPDDPWVDRSWQVAHAEGSGRVYPNFPDPALEDWAAAYHGDNHRRLIAIKQRYDPDRLFDFPQAI